MRNVTKIHVLTLFPEMIQQGLNLSVIGRAAEKGILSLNAVNIRDYTLDRHGKVDDYPYGGGAGMLMQAQPVYDAHRAVTGGRPVRTVYLTPQGIPFTQKMAGELAQEEELVFLCGHYEGIDERVLEKVVTDYVSIGDYVLTGGELPAMVMIDAIARLIPGVLGNDTSAEEESFGNGLLEYPHYSRPEVWQGESVPEVLLSGNHGRVAAWRLEQSLRRTADRRPDLYEKYLEKQRIIGELSREKRNNIHMMESLLRGRGEILYAAGESILLYDSGSGLCMLTVAEVSEGEGLAERIPEKAKWLVVSQDFIRDRLAEQGYRVFCECRQVLYTQREVLPVRRKCIRQLGIEDLKSLRVCCREVSDCATSGEVPGCMVCVEEYLQVNIEYAEEPKRADVDCMEKRLCASADNVEEQRADADCMEKRLCANVDYMEERLQVGAVYGAFVGDELTGFVGVHRAGNLGMLYVGAKWRKQGFGESLIAFAVNRMLEKGQTPYGYIPVEERASERLLGKLKFYSAKKTFWWLEKELANKECLC